MLARMFLDRSVAIRLVLLQTQLIKGLSDKAVENCHAFLVFLLLFLNPFQLHSYLPSKHYLQPLSSIHIWLLSIHFSIPLQHPHLASKHPLLESPPYPSPTDFSSSDITALTKERQWARVEAWAKH